MIHRPLTPLELAVLGAVHRADEEEGGLSLDQLEDDEREACATLVGGGLVELLSDDAGDVWARVTADGVLCLREVGMRR